MIDKQLRWDLTQSRTSIKIVWIFTLDRHDVALTHLELDEPVN